MEEDDPAVKLVLSKGDLECNIEAPFYVGGTGYALLAFANQIQSALQRYDLTGRIFMQIKGSDEQARIALDDAQRKREEWVLAQAARITSKRALGGQ